MVAKPSYFIMNIPLMVRQSFLYSNCFLDFFFLFFFFLFFMSLFFKRPPPFSDTTAACLLHQAPQTRVMMPMSVLQDFTARRAHQSPLGARLACSRTWPDWWVWISVRTARQVWGLGSLTLSACLVQIDGLVQERRNSIANALELRLSCTNPSKMMSSKKTS